MNIRYESAEVNPELMEEVVNLLDDVFGQTDDRRSKTSWAFEMPPGDPLPLVTARSESGALIGVRGGMPWALRGYSDEKGTLAVQLHGTAVDSSARRQGVFSTMTLRYLEELADRGVDLVFNVSVDASRQGYERMGWKYVPDLHGLFFPARPTRVARHLLKRGTTARRSVADVKSSPPEFNEILPFLESRDNQCQGLLRTEYSAASFAWRFAGPYRWLGDSSSGFLVYRVRTLGGLHEMLLGDVWPGARSARSLIKEAVDFSGADVVSSWSTFHHPMYKPLRRMGFIRKPGASLNLGFRAPRGDFRAPSSAFMAADIDTF